MELDERLVARTTDVLEKTVPQCFRHGSRVSRLNLYKKRVQDQSRG